MNIGFIGLGTMGEPMSLNIIRKLENKVYLFDIDVNKTKSIAAQGGIAALSVKEVVEKCDVIISMVPKSEHVESVYKDIVPFAKSGQIFIEMSTIDPKVSLELSQKVASTGAIMLDCPVVKSKPAAVSGELGIYVGGSREAFDKIEYILKCMGTNIIYMGKNGSGLIMKICHNMLVAQIQNGVNEMITLSEKLGISLDDFVTAVSYGGGQNFYLDGKNTAIARNDFTPLFSVENMYKDVNIAATIVKDENLDLPGVVLVNKIYASAMEVGLDKEDFSATIKVVRNK